ncbi:hypothetical protein F5X99DRAFT_424870 [Biscogniauxia marginata]|nr:hypothetical protein F5X99DRAFT_424870 [Biscogniauxia marginata]
MKVISASVLALTLTLTLGATASPQTSDIGVTDLLNSVLAGLQGLDKQVVAYKGGPPLALYDAAVRLYKTLQEGTATAEALKPIAPEEAEAIGPLARQVSRTGDSFLYDLGSARPAFEGAGICDYLYEYTVHLDSLTNNFFAAVGQKFPTELQPKAQSEIAGTNGLFEAAEAALAPDVCVNKIAAPSHDEGDAPPSPATSAVWYTTANPSPGSTGAPGGGNNNGSSHPKLPPAPIQAGGAARLCGFVSKLGAAAAFAIALVL